MPENRLLDADVEVITAVTIGKSSLLSQTTITDPGNTSILQHSSGECGIFQVLVYM